MYQRILLAFDGSADGREALAQTQGLALSCGATVHLVAIIDGTESMPVVEATSFVVSDAQRFAVQAAIDEGVRRLHDAGCSTMGALRYGKPSEQIVRAAKEMSADLIVVGHRDQGTLARWLNGSVGETILNKPPCSVLVAVKSETRADNVRPLEKPKTRGKQHTP
ncbi:universal stress protein [Bradyrhizobium sp. ISRA443]|uniref:universal stress protein n=1 Tax=unclassified Bradyrhizobium TaxID=2631580 RepID=UPI0024784810|nr:MULTISPECIES: universal stress protein [unclassified Bradyrhizobium]WGR93125.1 universal stress protein [Bradyrhizobium sp. ISRA435]WGR97634.1 universal stress protein [Bradyrhizobium sp. ISRA436]WGS04524.1 universal stress protein [Bradyrhizobium sp. ISRA437]WGS11405.1 universal stress protein [Bradyrhizobium sp. ISRA443]